MKKQTKAQVLRFYDKYVAANAPCRRKLCVHVVANQHAEEEKEKSSSSSAAAAAAAPDEEKVDDKETTTEETTTTETEGSTVTAAAADDKKKKKSNNNKVNIIRIEDPVDFRRSMPLFSMPPKADVEVVDLGINITGEKSGSTTEA